MDKFLDDLLDAIIISAESGETIDRSDLKPSYKCYILLKGGEELGEIFEQELVPVADKNAVIGELADFLNVGLMTGFQPIINRVLGLASTLSIDLGDIKNAGVEKFGPDFSSLLEESQTSAEPESFDIAELQQLDKAYWKTVKKVFRSYAALVDNHLSDAGSGVDLAQDNLDPVASALKLLKANGIKSVDRVKMVPPVVESPTEESDIKSIDLNQVDEDQARGENEPVNSPVNISIQNDHSGDVEPEPAETVVPEQEQRQSGLITWIIHYPMDQDVLRPIFEEKGRGTILSLIDYIVFNENSGHAVDVEAIKNQALEGDITITGTVTAEYIPVLLELSNIAILLDIDTGSLESYYVDQLLAGNLGGFYEQALPHVSTWHNSWLASFPASIQRIPLFLKYLGYRTGIVKTSSYLLVKISCFTVDETELLRQLQQESHSRGVLLQIEGGYVSSVLSLTIILSVASIKLVGYSTSAGAAITLALLGRPDKRMLFHALTIGDRTIPPGTPVFGVDRNGRLALPSKSIPGSVVIPCAYVELVSGLIYMGRASLIPDMLAVCTTDSFTSINKT